MWVEPKFKLNLKALAEQKNQESDSSSTVNTETEPKNSDTIANIKMQHEPQATTESEISEDTLVATQADSNEAEIKNPQKKSHNISFADLKKQIDKKSSPKISTANEDSISEIKPIETSKVDESEILESQSIANQDTTISDTENSYTSENNILQKNTDNVELISEDKDENSPQENITKQEEKTHESVTENFKQEEKKEEDENSQKDKIAIENAEKTKAILRDKEEKKSEKKKWFFSKFKRNKKEKNELTSESALTHESQALQSTKEITPTQSNEESAPKVVEKIHFSNYESHFKKESTNFLKRFQNFKYAPNTRVGMILWLIGLTVMIITTLMVFFPEKHSFQVYKASILELTWNSSNQWVINPVTNPPITEVLPPEIETPTIEDPIIEDPLENTPEDSGLSSQEESKEKLRQHLLNKYK